MFKFKLRQNLLVFGLLAALLPATRPTVLLVQDASQTNQPGVKIDIRLSAVKRVIVTGDALQLKVEIWNRSPVEDVYVCKDFEPQSSPLCGVDFTLEDTSGRFGINGGVATDFNPWNKEPFARVLVRDWIALRPDHFYGAIINLDSNSYPRLRKLGTYRVWATYKSSGLTNGYQGSVSFDPEEIAHLPAKSWQGEVDSNILVVRVAQKNN